MPPYSLVKLCIISAIVIHTGALKHDLALSRKIVSGSNEDQDFELVNVLRNETQVKEEVEKEPDYLKRGIFDDVTNGFQSLFSGFSASAAGSNSDTTSSGSLSLVPNHCWYRGAKYDCSLSITCAISGRKSMNLCNGGLIWSCCVDRDEVKHVTLDLNNVFFHVLSFEHRRWIELTRTLASCPMPSVVKCTIANLALSVVTTRSLDTILGKQPSSNKLSSPNESLAVGL